MKQWLIKVPYPASGLMLAYATLGNLLGAMVHPLAKTICGLLASAILFILLLKIIVVPSSFKQGFSQLPIASVLVTFPMGVMILSTYLLPISRLLAMSIWFVALTINCGLIIGFTMKHLKPILLEKILASYFVLYIGIVCASVTARIYDMALIGQVAFVFGLLAYVVLLPLVTYRYVKLPVVKDPLKPLIAIFAAPANLLVVGYVSLGLNWSNTFVMILWVIGIATTCFVYVQLIRLRQLPFFPSFAAYTFPLVIGVVATFKTSVYLNLQGPFLTAMTIIGYGQLVICLGMMLKVTVLYVAHQRLS